MLSKKSLNDLTDILFEIKDKKELRDFLQGILTPKEINELSTRLQIIRMLKKGTPHHEIAKKLKVGVATVTRGSKELQLGRFKSINSEQQN